MQRIYFLVMLILVMLFGGSVYGADKSKIDAKNSGQKDSSNKVEKIEAGTQMLLVFPTTPREIPFSEKQLSLFRGSLSETDRLGIVVADRKQQILPLNPKNKQPVSSASVIESFSGTLIHNEPVVRDSAARETRESVNMDEVLRSAVAQLSDLQGMLKAVVLVLDGPVVFSRSRMESSEQTVHSADDADSGGENGDTVAMLSSLLTLNGIILYTVYPESVENEMLETLTSQSGGKNLYLSSRLQLNDALYWVYDSLLLRTIQLAPQQALYESDEVCPPPVSDVVAPHTQTKNESGVSSAVGISLQLVSVVLCLALLVLAVFIWKRVGLQQPSNKSKEGGDKEKQASSFSKLTIGLNRVRNSFAETETKLHVLSAELDDFGSENWELQKKIISAYAEMAGELFLLYDHVTLKNDSELSDGDKLLKRKIEQLLDAADVEEICPESGEKFHSKYHCHAGEKYSEQKAGSVLEVVRKGYQRKGFVSEEPFVIRQAEVVVSAGTNQGGKL